MTNNSVQVLGFDLLVLCPRDRTEVARHGGQASDEPAKASSGMPNQQRRRRVTRLAQRVSAGLESAAPYPSPFKLVLVVYIIVIKLYLAFLLT